jgi:hypothetical protein
MVKMMGERDARIKLIDNIAKIASVDLALPQGRSYISGFYLRLNKLISKSIALPWYHIQRFLIPGNISYYNSNSSSARSLLIVPYSSEV